jgi:FkbM family methyltransferase
MNLNKGHYSQFKQDLNVLKFYNNKKDLFFLDIGANDGITYSNTYLLEKKYNWKGICSEPLPKAYDKLIKCRSVICDQNAVFSESNLKLFFSCSNIISGITDYIDCHTGVKKKKQIEVNTITLNDLLHKYNSPNIIHYLSLDTEGTEFEILKNVNFNQYKFLCINLEHNFIEPKRTEIRNLLEDNGYLYVGENNVDDDYIHESILIGTYYKDNDFSSNPIIIEKKDNNVFSIKSDYWTDDECLYDKSYIYFKPLNRGKIYYNYIDFGDQKWNKK